MQKIIPHLWYDKQAKEAVELYVTLFSNSKIKSLNVIKDTPSGDCDMLSFTLAGQDFMAISAGPYFKLNPAVSFFVVFENEQEIKAVWDKLIVGGKALMEYNTYPWAQKYGWLQDKFGLSWQLSFSDNHKLEQKITPMLMFTKTVAGKAKEALGYYTSVFSNSKIDMVVPYAEGEGDSEDFVKHSRFSLAGQNFMAMDSSAGHEFTFNEAVSFVVECEDQKEIDYYWEKLSAVKESEQCGWVKDKFGVSWQIVPKVMQELMSSKDKERTARVTKAFLKMKKFDIQALKDAFEGK
jgi:predicted 3-demethylubiquinone-9 3-methyltransferase (glyoxalase superfamily)